MAQRDTPPPYPRNLMTIAQAAEQTGTTEADLRARISDGDLATVSTGSGEQLHPDDLDRARISA